MSDAHGNGPRPRAPLTLQWGRSAPDATLRAELETANGAIAALRDRVDALEAYRDDAERRMRDLLDQNTALVQLAVASQLLSTVDGRDGVFDAIEQIVINMIGSEELAIFELSPREAEPRLVRSLGLDSEQARFARAQARIREALTSGRTLFPPGRELTAVVPLKVDDTVCGAVAVFRLLEQKRVLDGGDHELLELVSRQAGIALLFSTLRRSLTPTIRPAAGTPR